MKNTKRITGRITGFQGWQDRLRTNYDTFDSWEKYAELYGLHLKLGFKTPKAAWEANPLIQGSVDPRDFCRVLKNGTRWVRQA